ncbi:MAG: hypothetical protein ABL876_15650 [Chitinophagaceae bacterium]
MSASSTDNKLTKYWSLLSPEQKKSLLTVITSFIQSADTNNQELREPEAVYYKEVSDLPAEILQLLNEEQKEALISLIASFGIEITDQRISIEQYNKELDEADAEFEKGEFMSHDEVIVLSKKWIHG